MPDSQLRENINARFRKLAMVQSFMMLAIILMLGMMLVMGYMLGKSAERGNLILKELAQAKAKLDKGPLPVRCNPLQPTMAPDAGRFIIIPTPGGKLPIPSTATR